MSKRTEQREAAFGAIDSERDYQDALSRNVVNREDQEGFSPMSNLCIIEELCAQMKSDFYKKPGHPSMDYMRKIAATAVRTMESFGAPLRGERSLIVGDIVEKNDHLNKKEVVISINPLIFVTEDCDLVRSEEGVGDSYEIVGQADDELMAACRAHFQKALLPPNSGK